MWCGGCLRMKATCLFVPSQRRKADGSRRCMMCEREKNKHSRIRTSTKKWRGHDNIFPHTALPR